MLSCCCEDSRQLTRICMESAVVFGFCAERQIGLISEKNVLRSSHFFRLFFDRKDRLKPRKVTHLPSDETVLGKSLPPRETAFLLFGISPKCSRIIIGKRLFWYLDAAFSPRN